MPPQCYVGVAVPVDLQESRMPSDSADFLQPSLKPEWHSTTQVGPVGRAVWAPISVNGVAPEQRQPAIQRRATEFVWTPEAYINTLGLQRLGYNSPEEKDDHSSWVLFEQKHRENEPEPQPQACTAGHQAAWKSITVWYHGLVVTQL